MIRAIWHKELITEKDAGSGAHPASFVVRHCAVACSHHQERCRLLMRIPELHVRKCAVKTLLVQRPIADHLCSAGTKSTNQETLQPSEATPCMDCHCLPAPRQAFAARLCVTTLSRGRTTSRPAGPDVPGSASNTKPGQRGGGDTGS